ncbi:hypothetical protein Pcinc_042314 [Petrolisthes cinctipes]|uniref:Uncharacterized protein n=1 Tax=Petrolisthes cinctipes TaxID=88211 RepID=A0AAE1EH46_PETCI|nr:hypothetical protein Pcinc_042314 [Petrolisthes cinctipes]
MAGRGNRGGNRRGGGPGGGQQQSRGSEERENDTSRPATSVSEPDIHSDQEEALLSNPADCGTCKKEIESFEKKKEILKNARNLKFAKDWTREVGIMKDMTPRERTQHKELMKKLFEKRGNGELGYYVYDGKLLRNKAYAN